MKDTQALLEGQFSFFDLHLSRLKCLCRMVQGLIQVRTVNVSELSLCFGPEAQKLSSFRRIQRFLAQVCFPFDQLSLFVWQRFQGDEPTVIALDRTNWKFGKKNLNILMLSICRDGFAVPLMWKVLTDKRGVSSQEERIALMERFVSLVKTDQIVRLVADREFIGAQWLNWLDEHHIHFIIRIRSNQQVAHRVRKSRRADSIFSSEQWKSLRKQHQLKGVSVYMGGQKLATGDYLILISNLPTRSARYYYAKRWEIEVLFSALKKRGFNFERTHITQTERINNLIAVLALALVWAVAIGQWIIDHSQKIPIKKHGRKAISIFRLGLDTIRCKMLNNNSLEIDIKLLSCT